MRLLPDNFRFAEPGWFWLLLLLPLLLLLRGAAGRQSALQFSSLHLLRGAGRKTRSALMALGMFLTVGAMALGIAGMARPQKLRTEEKIEESGVEIFMALDLSLSMSIQDMRVGNEKVDRLTVAKKVTRDFIRKRPSDRVGFVVFSGRPYLASPLTLDKNWLEESLDKIWFNQTGDMGTAIGSALATASKRLTNRESRSKIIILVTDGANNSGKIGPREAAKLAATLGIKIYAIAIGTDGYHQVPVPTPDGMHVGVRQEFDEETLKEVARVTNGRFYQARDANAMDSIFKEIDRLEKTKLNVRRSTLIDELFMYPLWGAVGVAGLGLLARQTILRRYP